MVVAAVLTPLVVLAAVAAVVAARCPPSSSSAVGIADRDRPLPRWQDHAATVTGPRLSLARGARPSCTAVERLCALADLPKPETSSLDEERQPNSWIVAPAASARSCTSRSGLLAARRPRSSRPSWRTSWPTSLNRDAMVMTVVGTPGAVLLEGGRRFWGAWWLWFGNGLALAIGWVASSGRARCRATASWPPTRVPSP